MSRPLVIRSVWTFGLIGLLVLSGCGRKTAVVKGTVVLPANVKLIESDSAKIIFMPEEKDRPACSGAISTSDNSFVAHNPTNKGLPPGKYKVTVRLQPYPGSKGSEKRQELFARINDKYDELASKLTYEVTEEPTQSITIDLTKGTIAKN